MARSVVCRICGTEFSARSSRAKFCSDRCRKRNERGPKAARAEVVAFPVTSAASGGLVEAVTARLSAAGKLESFTGQQAVFIAGRLVSASADTGASVASLSKELDRLMGVALADVVEEPDELDEVQARVLEFRSRRRG